MKPFKNTMSFIRHPIQNCACLLMCMLVLLSVSIPASADDNNTSGEAKKRWNDRYAVVLYGTQHDTYGEDHKIAGLTFGPATGKNYLRSYRAHVKKAVYEEDPENNICLHWMTWEEIAAQSLKDPSVFQQCLERGCSHAVDLNLNKKLLQKNYASKITGDGAGAILDGVKRGFLSWNSGKNCSGGWPACRARAVLNGADDLFNPKVAGEKYALTAEECLFSCFPTDLQKLIVEKAVVSDLGNDGIKKNCVTTYDKLWLFSASELYGGRSSAEGKAYERNRLIRSKTARFGGGYVMYSETGNEAWAWFRSVSASSEVLNRHIYGGGHLTDSGYYNVFGLAPGFCLP